MAAFRDGYCAHPNAGSNSCSPTIVKSHTIQKRGGLAAIAEEGHVLTVKPTMQQMIETEGHPSVRKIGINKASVFPGFCGKHDDEIFKPVEGKSLILTKDTAFLFAYRAISYELFSKEAQLRGEEARREADRGHPFWKQTIVQTTIDAMITGIKIGIRDMKFWKKQFDDRLISCVFDDFRFLAIRFGQTLPVVACAGLYPEFDFQGRVLQRLERVSSYLDHITLTVTAFEGETIAVFGWVGSDEGAANLLTTSLMQIQDDRKADALLRFLFIHTDNLFIRPSWWDALSADDQNYLNELIKSGTTARMRSGAELCDDSRSFGLPIVVEIVRG